MLQQKLHLYLFFVLGYFLVGFKTTSKIEPDSDAKLRHLLQNGELEQNHKIALDDVPPLESSAIQLQVQTMGGGGIFGAVLGAVGTCILIVTCITCCKRFCGGFCNACRCRRACHCLMPCMYCCGCDDYKDFRLRIDVHALKEAMSSQRSMGDSIQVRAIHDTRVYKTEYSSKERGQWEEDLKIYVQQGVKRIFFELWEKTMVSGQERIIGECSVDIYRDIVKTGYPGKVWIQMRRRGVRVALLRLSFFRDGSKGDILAAHTALAEEAGALEGEESVSFEINEHLKQEVARAAQRPLAKVNWLIPVQVLQDSTNNYGNEFRALNALAQITQGMCKTPRGFMFLSGTHFFAMTHTKGAHPLQGWCLNRYDSKSSFDAGGPYNHSYPTNCILSVMKTASYVIVKHQAADGGKDEDLYLTPKDRELELWYQGLSLFLVKLEVLQSHFRKFKKPFSLQGDPPFQGLEPEKAVAGTSAIANKKPSRNMHAADGGAGIKEVTQESSWNSESYNLLGGKK